MIEKVINKNEDNIFREMKQVFGKQLQNWKACAVGLINMWLKEWISTYSKVVCVCICSVYCGGTAATRASTFETNVALDAKLCIYKPDHWILISFFK